MPASNLIPVSLPDSSFWPTPALGHHSQEYAYSTSDAIAHQGLGIIKPFPSDFPQPHPFKSAKPTHAFSRSPVPYLVYPVNIAHKEWLRQNPSPLPRKVERDRCDPQAEEEDAFVEKLRDQNTPWNLVRQQFSKKFNKELPEARLSMRLLRRRKERLARREDKVAKDLVKTQVR